MKNKRTKEEYEAVIKDSYCIADVCGKLGIKPIGGNYIRWMLRYDGME